MRGNDTYRLQNREVKDNGAKLIFGDPVLCAEFLRGYTHIELLKDIQPEDIEDVSERFLPMFQKGRDSDSVKKIHLPESQLFLITLIEHQSKVSYDMAFKMLRYIVLILTDYENEQERLHKGITKTKDFKYPPVLPIVYYENSDTWTAPLHFHERVALSDVLGEYIPDFKYMVVPISSYSNEEIIQKQDELSLVMLINKLKSSEDFKTLKEIPPEYFENLKQKTPEYLLELLGKIIAAFLYRLNLPREEVEEFTDHIERRDFDMLFDSFEAYDVQETRRISREEGLAEGLSKGHSAGLMEGLSRGRTEGLMEGLSRGECKDESKVTHLIQLLLAANRISDVELAVADKDARERFYQEFGIE